MIRVRVDDFPNTKDGEKDRHSLAAYREFHRRLSECLGGKRYLLGVIPGRCSPDDILFLRNETDCVVGMHGCRHDEEKLDVYQNEFEPYLTEWQVETRLMYAHQALETGVGREINIYMPPRNQIDARTVRALKSSGMFSRFTTGPETNKELRAQNHSWQIHSEPPYEYGRTDEMYARGAHEVLIQRGATQDTVLTLHWTWETNIGLHHMSKFFSMIPPHYFGDF